jgi:hypothetical protein
MYVPIRNLSQGLIREVALQDTKSPLGPASSILGSGFGGLTVSIRQYSSPYRLSTRESTIVTIEVEENKNIYLATMPNRPIRRSRLLRLWIGGKLPFSVRYQCAPPSLFVCDRPTLTGS